MTAKAQYRKVEGKVMNPTIAAYLAAGQTQRRFNAYFAVLHGLVVASGAYALMSIESTAQVLVGIFGGVCAVGLFQAFANLVLLASRPRIDATDDEIVAAAASGPRWFRRRVAQAVDLNN